MCEIIQLKSKFFINPKGNSVIIKFSSPKCPKQIRWHSYKVDNKCAARLSWKHIHLWIFLCPSMDKLWQTSNNRTAQRTLRFRSDLFQVTRKSPYCTTPLPGTQEGLALSTAVYNRRQATVGAHSQTQRKLPSHPLTHPHVESPTWVEICTPTQAHHLQARVTLKCLLFPVL